MPTIAIGSSLPRAAWTTTSASTRPLDLVDQVAGHRDGGRVVEDQGGVEPEPGGVAEPVAQLDRAERVEPELLEGGGGVDRLRRGVAEDDGGVLADEVEHDPLALRRRQPGEATLQRARRSAGAAAAAPDQAEEERRQQPGGDGGAQRARLQRRGDGERGGAVAGAVEQLQPGLGPEQRDADPRQARAVGVVEVRRSPRSRCSQSPQAIAVAGSPSARRRAARPSRKELAAA